MSKYARVFKQLLKEDDAALDRAAMEASLDTGISGDEFDTDPNQVENEVADEVADAMSRRNTQIIGELQGWIDKVDVFLQFLNGEESSSIQSRLAAAEPDTVMDKMKQSQQTKISRVASDLASLHQSLLGFMAQTKNTKFKYVAWAMFGALNFLSMGGLNGWLG
jgi:hypothetical protein